MILPGYGLTRDAHARILAALVRVTELSPKTLADAVVEADRGCAVVLDPMPAIRRLAYQAAAYGQTHARDDAPRTGTALAAHVGRACTLSPVVAGLVVGATIGLRLGLQVRISRSRGTSKRRPRPRLATSRQVVARAVTKAEGDLVAAREFGRDMGRVARASVRGR
jgi:hypothetical protein